MEFLKSLTSKYSITYIALLDTLAFILGNIFLYILFSIYTDINVYHLLILVVLSFWILGLDFHRWESLLWFLLITFLIFSEINNNYKLVIIVVSIIVLVIRLFLIRKNIKKNKDDYPQYPKFKNKMSAISKFLFVLPRILFLNISHYMFPLLFFWLPLIAFIHYLGFLEVSDLPRFVSIITLLGIMFGFFQYYFKRYKENIQKKYVSRMTDLVLHNNEFTFNNFKDFVSKKGLTEIDKLITKEKSAINQMKQFFYAQRRGMSINQFFMNITTQGSKDSIKFLELEDKAEESKKMKQLLEAYDKFFNHQKEKVIKNIDMKRLRNLSWFLMSNMNILSEGIATLGTMKLPEEKHEPENYEEYFEKTNHEILNKVFKDLIFN
jgi:hypothetical protein